MIGHQMSAAFLAVLALAQRRLLEYADMFRASGDFHRVRLPERKGIDRSARPGAARYAMAVAHGFRLAGHFDLDASAEAFAFVCFHFRISDPLNLYAQRPNSVAAVLAADRSIRMTRVLIPAERRYTGAVV